MPGEREDVWGHGHQRRSTAERIDRLTATCSFTKKCLA